MTLIAIHGTAWINVMRNVKVIAGMIVLLDVQKNVLEPQKMAVKTGAIQNVLVLVMTLANIIVMTVVMINVMILVAIHV